MAFRIQLFFVYATLYLLSLYSATAFTLFKPAKAQPRIAAFTWSDCGPSTDMGQIKSITVAPDPINIPGNITVSTTFNLATAAPLDAVLTIVLEAKVAGFWIKVPCVEDIGSCNYTDLCKNWAVLCPKYFEKYGIPCTCPIPANTYTVTDFVADISEKLPIKLKGDVRITGNFLSPTAGHLACVQVQVTVAS